MDLPPSISDPGVRRVPRIHIVGRKNNGKTTLICDLVEELTRQGYRVATVKHTHHHHELDTPGKDSHRHREAGAAGVGILSARMLAAFVPMVRSDIEVDRYAAFEVMFADCDVILVEGDLQTTAPRLEVWRSCLNESPYAMDDSGIQIVVTDDVIQHSMETLRRSDVPAIASRVLQIIGVEHV